MWGSTFNTTFSDRERLVTGPLARLGIPDLETEQETIIATRNADVNKVTVNENKTVSDAFSASSQMTSGILWDIFVIWILNFIISAICGPFFFVSTPFVTIVFAKYSLFILLTKFMEMKY